jgi:hypothetical protein
MVSFIRFFASKIFKSCGNVWKSGKKSTVIIKITVLSNLSAIHFKKIFLELASVSGFLYADSDTSVFSTFGYALLPMCYLLNNFF